MKLSLKLPEDQWHHNRHDQTFYHPNPPLLKAKIPISIFNQPFLTSIYTTPTATTTTSPASHLSFSLSSDFDSGPSLRFSYSPTSTTSPPFSLSLKSGLGLFGSANHSPLVFKAHFSFSSTNPTFSLHFKPQFGNFSLKKTTFSNPNGDLVSGSGSDRGVRLDSGSRSDNGLGNGFVPEGSSAWQELKLEPCSGKNGVADGDCKVGGFGVCSNGGGERALAWKDSEKDGFLSGITVMARTVLPVTKRVAVNMKWGVNFPSNLGSKMPYLTLNKIGIERVEEEKEEKKKKKKTSDESSVSDLELLKGMCFWMRRDLELLEKENREMKQSLEQMKSGVSGKRFRSGSDNGGKIIQLPSGENSSEFERWKNKKTVKEENGRRDSKKSATSETSDLESELQKAIKAASAS
ncbi:hypothetical protein PanWU01x14_176840 [Parasponia andersonii]|uniref:Uncharacterized protein n=1 Tax=Parasponia andersonii TaxID=3476 RepID=A0A2P5C7X3_PARAD|nr:hypothetical protein PanWU01x14_176840 [Parasponia andersonii]